MKLSLSHLFQTRFNIALFRHLPPILSYYLMLLFGKLYYQFKRTERRLIERNIRDLVGPLQSEREAIASTHMASDGGILDEGAKVPRKIPPD